MMKRLHPLLALFAVALSASAPQAAEAQLIGLSDEIIVISKGLGEQQRRKTEGVLGHTQGAGANPFQSDPSRRGAPLETPVNPAQASARFVGAAQDALQAISSPGPRIGPRPSVLAAARPGLAADELPPIYGTLDLPTTEYEGPSDGLTLDQAIERLVRDNNDLRAKYYEIPQARADVLTAGLRADPFYFLSASSYPYQAYSPARPGNNGYSASIVHPFDVNGKRKARSQAAAQAVRVLEAQYQDAVRLAIDGLYAGFLDVMVARETLRYAEASFAGAEKLAQAVELQLRSGAIAEPEALNVTLQREAAEIGVKQARAQWMRAKKALAAQLNIAAAAAARLDVRGLLRDTAPPPPGRDELVRTALGARPDLAAFRLGIQRAQADVRVARKDVMSDIFVIYSPYEFRNNAPVGGQNATSYSFGLLGTMPLYNRGQGEIRRTQLNVSQMRAALAGRERDVVQEVEDAELEYHASREAAERMERVILPASTRIRHSAAELYARGEKGLLDVLDAQRAHNEIVRQYREAVIRHRRSMLRLNTAVGRRLLP